MAHIHLPDGVLPIEWALIYWAMSLSIIACITLYFRRTKRLIDIKALSIAGAATAVAFVAFQVEIPLLGGIHLNFTPMLGILVGPLIGSASSLIINLLSSALGHGGWGPIGLNFLVNLTEIFVASACFRLLFRRFKRSMPTIAFAAALIALTASNALMVGMLSTSGIQGVAEHIEETGAEAEAHEHGALLENLLLLAAINEVAAVLEAVVTGFLVAYVLRVKPDLIGGKRA